MSQVELTTLGKSCAFFNGKAHEKSIDENGKYIVVNSKFISSEGKSFKRTKEQMFPLYKGDIVMVMSDVPNGKALAKCFIIDKDDTYSLNQRICCIRSKEFDTKYLYYQLNRHEHFLAFNNGENQTNLRKDDILACPLIKPSMEEQRRMVAELDKALIGIENIKQNITRNIFNVDDIYNCYSQGLFESKGKLWVTKKLGDVYKFKNGINFDKTQKNGNGIFTIDVLNMYGVGLNVNLDSLYRIDKPISSDYLLKNGDILIVRSSVKEEGVAWASYFVEGNEKYTFCGFIIRGRPSIELNPKYITYYLRSGKVRKELISKAVKSTITNINQQSLSQLNIPIPPLEEQEEIVNQLDTLSFQLNQMKELYLNKLGKIEELKYNILKRAFENELIEAE